MFTFPDLRKVVLVDCPKICKKINGILLESAEYLITGSIPEYSLREELGHVLFVHMHGIYGGIKL